MFTSSRLFEKSRGWRRLGWALAILVMVGVWAGCSKPTEPNANSSVSSSQPSATNTPTTNPTVKPEFQALVGKWLRPDGGYVLDIRSVNAEGKLDTGYFNPSPINVSRAAAARDSEGTKVMVELRDANYPGCIYQLKYDPKTDQLFGTYYQAAMEQTFDVVFERMK